MEHRLLLVSDATLSVMYNNKKFFTRAARLQCTRVRNPPYMVPTKELKGEVKYPLGRQACTRRVRYLHRGCTCRRTVRYLRIRYTRTRSVRKSPKKVHM